jgi:hypothetical protein
MDLKLSYDSFVFKLLHPSRGLYVMKADPLSLYLFVIPIHIRQSQ